MVKAYYRDLPGGGFESGGVTFDKSGNVTGTTSEQGTKTVIKTTKQAGGFENQGVLFDKSGNIVGALTTQGENVLGKLAQQEQQKRNLEAAKLQSRANLQNEAIQRSLANEARVANLFNLKSSKEQALAAQSKIERLESSLAEKLRIARSKDIEKVSKGKPFTQIPERTAALGKGLKTSAERVGLTFINRLVQNVIGLGVLAKKTAGAIRYPKNFIPLGKEFYQGVKADVVDTAKLLYVSPGEGVAKIGGDYVFFKGTKKGLQLVGKATGFLTAVLDPRFKGIARTGVTLEVDVGRRIANLKVVGGIGGKTLPRESIGTKLGRQGTTPLAVSTQADALVSLLRREKIIRKPLANEATLPKPIKALLNKFDTGRITPTEIIVLDKLLKGKGIKGLLERSFFVDPEGRIRPSRSGLIKEASIRDIFSGQVTFKRPKPQILVFSDISVESLPPSLKGIETKLRRGQTLTAAETGRLLNFQLTKSGKFKPLGFGTGEPELTLAPGEIIYRKKVVGITLINGKKTPIVLAGIKKASAELSELIRRFKEGKLLSKELKLLDNLYRKETGISSKVTSSVIKNTKYFPISRNVLSKVLADISKASSTKQKIKIARRVLSPSSKGSESKRLKYLIFNSPYPELLKSTSPTIPRSPGSPIISKTPGSPRSPGSPGSPGSPIIPKTPGSPGYPGSPLYPSSTPPARLGYTSLKRINNKQKQGYTVLEKRGKGQKFYILNRRPLSKKEAYDLLSWRLDNKISKTGKILSLGYTERLASLNKNIKGYFRRERQKFRDYKIKSKKKIPFAKGLIEKRKYGLDKRGEKRQIKLNKAAKRR